jgi:hypothetical protein
MRHQRPDAKTSAAPVRPTWHREWRFLGDDQRVTLREDQDACAELDSFGIGSHEALPDEGIGNVKNLSSARHLAGWAVGIG